MQICRVNPYSYSPANQRQQACFKGFNGKRMVTEEELMQQTFEAAIKFGINVVGKDFRTVARELIETKGLLKQAREYGFTPFSQELSELREEVANAKQLYSKAQSYGINTAGKSIGDVIIELNQAQARANAAAKNPFRQDRAKSAYSTEPQSAISMRELKERGPKTKDEAIAVLNYLGAGITAKSSRDEILSATSRLMKKLHPQKTGGDDTQMKLVTAAKSLLAPSSTGLHE